MATPQVGDKKKLLMAVALIVVVAAIVAGITYKVGFKGWSSTGYQAVFLNNDQVYFGHLSWSRGKAKLTDVHYMRVTTVLQPQTNTPQQDLQIVKLGGELHGPEDGMFITKENIMFWENLRNDSAVVKSIQKLKEAGTTTNK